MSQAMKEADVVRAIERKHQYQSSDHSSSPSKHPSSHDRDRDTHDRDRDRDSDTSLGILGYSDSQGQGQGQRQGQGRRRWETNMTSNMTVEGSDDSRAHDEATRVAESAHMIAAKVTPSHNVVLLLYFSTTSYSRLSPHHTILMHPLTHTINTPSHTPSFHPLTHAINTPSHTRYQYTLSHTQVARLQDEKRRLDQVLLTDSSTYSRPYNGDRDNHRNHGFHDGNDYHSEEVVVRGDDDGGRALARAQRTISMLSNQKQVIDR